MEPVPAPKKIWIPDGRVAVMPSVLEEGSVHGGVSCEECHGGDTGANSRAAAHSTGFAAIPLADACASCHGTTAMLADETLHTTLEGYRVSLAARSVDLADPIAEARFDAQCTKCHTAADDTSGKARSACGQCHVSVPATSGGGLVAGHAFQRRPSMAQNCTACHGSRVKDEYYGLNNTLLGRNRAALPDTSPWKSTAFSLQPDVHKTAGKDCVFCHTGGEMHGVGAPDDAGRFEVSVAPACEDCHGGPSDTSFHGVALHQTARHLESMSCQVCHAQPYKNCFECHVDVTAQNVAFYKINMASPYWDPQGTAAPDALITFRAGRNPRFVPGGAEKEFVVLRHVPIDRTTFEYTGANLVTGIVGDVTARTTWFPATPHTILRSTPITSACANCHGADTPKFWLTDPVNDAYGWISPVNAVDEADANDSLVR